MKLKPHSLVLVLLALALPGLASAQDAKKNVAKPDAGKAVAVVNGTKIPQVRAQALIAEQKNQGTAESDELRKQVREELIRRELLAQEARKKGLDKKPEIQGQMDLARDAILVRAYLQDYVNVHPISDESLRKEYEQIVQNLGSKEYKARHVLVEKEDEAKAVVEKLKKGEKIEDIAKAQSKDPGSKENGGELGWAPPSSYVKPFAEALKALEKGKYTEVPVKTDFGYHVILLEDVRDMKLPTFEEAKPGLQQRMQQAQVQSHILDLRKKAKVE